MSSDSKKRSELKKQLASRAQTASIDTVEAAISLLKTPKNWQTVDAITALPENIETQNFILCFDDLNMNVCVWDQFNPAKGKKLVDVLKKISSCPINKFGELKLER
ncbi:MAG: hypothetical protein UV60_C0009G0028, partial [Parcubacteria group bacterium GW2011_GWA2_43_11]